MVSDKDKCFRLRGIPKDYGETQIQDTLAREFSLNENIEIEIHSLACNPVRREEMAATIGFSAIPESLARQPDYFMDIPGSRRQLHLDTHFEGFTPLHATPDDECEIDVVAISGLNSHAFGSFKQIGRKRMWLRDDLPSDFAQARIFIYGYDTSPEHHAFQNIIDIADTFRKTLATLRGAYCQRPLVFIAHSLGGIIVKADDQDKRNILSLRALFFFGVPNNGMNIESLISMNPDITNRRILYSLDNQNSADLRTISEKFTRNFKDTITISFYETLKSPTARRQANGSWAMTGPVEILVSTDSATQGKVFDDGSHFVFQVQRTHSNMVKLNGPHDHVYEHVRYRLTGAIENLGKRDAVPHDFLEDEKACLQSLWFPEQNDRQLQATDPAQGTCSWILKNTEFRKWHTSRSSLLWILGPPGAGKSTLLKSVLEWKNSRRKDGEVIAAFFVHGRGKSDMQHSPLGLYRALLHQVLQQFPRQLAILAHKYRRYTDSRGEHGVSWTWSEPELRDCFFDILTTETPTRPVTVLVDALDEISSSRADSETTPVKDLITALKKFTDGHIPDHTGGKLKFLVSCRYYPVVYDNSGLSISMENYNGKDITTMIESHEALNDMGGEDDSLKQIIATRANGIFLWVSVVLDEVTRLHNRGMTFKNIKKAIKTVPDKLQDLYHSLILRGDFDERKQAFKLFIWLIFAARPLSLAEYRDALAIDPAMEHTSFAQLSESTCFGSLHAMERIIHNLSRGLVQIQRNQRPEKSRFNPEFCPKDEVRQSDPIYDGRWQTLQLIHQSILDYLKNEGLAKLAASIGKPEFSAQWELSRSCIRYLSLQEIINRPFEFSKRNHNKREFKKFVAIPLAFDFPLTEYAHSFWLLHVMKAEEENADQQDLFRFSPLKGRNGYLPDSCNLRLTYNSPFYAKNSEKNARVGYSIHAHPVFEIYRTFVGRVDNLFQFWDKRVYGMGEQYCRALLQQPSSLALVELLSLTGLRNLALDLEGDSPKCEKIHLLQYALLGRRRDIVEWTLKELTTRRFRHLLDPDEESHICLPLAIATAKGDQVLVERLLDAGAKVNAVSGGDKPYTALGMAARQGKTEMAKMLLYRGADPMERIFGNGLEESRETTTPHFAAAESGYDSVVGILLDQRYPKGSMRELASMRSFRWKLTLLHMCHTGAIIRTLLNHGADPNAKDFAGQTPLHIHSRSSKLVRLLLRYGGNPSIRDGDGQSPLQRNAGQSKKAYNLMFNWTDSSLRSAPMLHVMTCREKPISTFPWRSSVRENTVEFIRLALNQYGANLNHNWNRRDREGCTLLAVAVENNIPEIVDLLLDSGIVDVTIPDNQGITPLDKAMRYGYYTVTEVLKRSLEIDQIPISEGDRSMNSVFSLREEDTLPSSRSWGSRKEEVSSRRRQDQQAGQRAKPVRQPRHRRRSQNHSCCTI